MIINPYDMYSETCLNQNPVQTELPCIYKVPIFVNLTCIN